MTNIKLIENPDLKSQVTENILRALPEWFGIEQAIVNYIQGVRNQDFYGIFDQDTIIGFASIKLHNQYTAEIYVMGLLKEYHHQGIGTELINRIERDLHQLNYRFLMVKTLGESHKDINYKKTRKFYQKVGFYPLEEIKEIWGNDNPCLILVKNIGKTLY